ncbi:phage tail tape measure protein [Bacteroides timonensis]|uniref:phage tail tape measure protein n=1 Tax=Bacteroides timonensis TaxID=1470345 RepID=UPI0004B4BD18|nr:phage tail tape measure protein [Bacteroides timonensis]
MANDLNRSIKIYIDGTPAAQGAATVEAAIQKLEEKLANLSKSEANYESKSRKLKKELEAKNRTLQNYRAKVEETERVLNNLSGATYNELIAVQSQVRKQLRDAVPGTTQYTAALEQNRRVTEALTRAQSAMRVEVGCQGTTFGKAIGIFNKYAAVVTAGIAAITGVTLKLNQLREKRNQREEAKADVKALTGLDDASVNWLEQEAKRLSTAMDESGIRIRQSATEILDAYKLVGSAKPELLEDKEALAEVTKQTLILASASGMTLKDAVDAVTLSLNQYGDGADQAGRYANVMAAGSKFGAAGVESVTEAVTKSGVAASSANIPIEQLVGTIETLAEKGIKDEIAGTGLKKFFLTLQTGADETNPKIVGLETALNNLQQKQLSAAQIKKQFGEEGYNVASVLINEAEKVKYYTEAVTGTTVAVDQAAIKSATAAAKLDQAKNKMNEMGIALMEKLNPAIVQSINGVVSWGSKFIKLVDFITRNMGTISVLTTLIATYYTANKLAAFYENKLREAKLASLATDQLTIIRQKALLAGTLALSMAKYALTGNIKLAVAAFKALNTAMKGNLFGLIASLVVGAGMAIYKFATRTNDAKEAVKSFLEQSEEERRHLRVLIDTTKSAADKTQRRKELIEEINTKYGQYLPNLLNEYSTLKDIEQAYRDINKAMSQNFAQKALQEKIDFIHSDTLEGRIKQMNDIREILAKELPESELNPLLQGLTTTVDKYIESGHSVKETTASIMEVLRTKNFKGRYLPVNDLEDEIEDYVEKIEEMVKRVNNTKKEMNPFIGTPQKKKLDPVNVLPEVVITPTAKPKTDPDEKKAEKARKAALEKEKILYDKQQADIKKIYAEGHSKELKTEKQYETKMLDLKKEHFKRIINIAGKGTSEAADAEKQLGDIQIQERKKAVDLAIEEEQALYEKQQRDLKELFISQSDENLKTEKDYEDAKEQLAIMHLQRSLEIAGMDADARKSIEEQLLDFKMKCIQEELSERKKAADREAKIAADLAKKQLNSGKQQHTAMMQYANSFGEAIGNVIAGQENALANFGDSMVDIVFDVLTTMIDAELIRLTGIGITTIAEAQAREIGSKGFLGIATGAALAAVIGGTIAAARAGLKALIGGKKSSSSASDTENKSPTANVTVRQWASGNYDVIGEEDGKTYRDVPYIGPAPTGIVHRTALISERGDELIINAEDLARLQKHVNYPLVIDAIQDARSGRVPQRAAGNYTPVETGSYNAISSPTPETTSQDEGKINQLIAELRSLIATLKHLKAYVVLRDLRDAEELDRKSKKAFTKQNK